MPRIDYEASEFPASYGTALSGTKTLAFTWSELVWAAISVGRAELMHILRHGPFSAFEIVYRAAILFANLRETDTGHLARSAAYEGLDPSEKGAVSYFMGLSAAKLLSDRLLDVPWLMHVDVYRQELQIPRGTTRPDLVGQNAAGQWIAVESKGRTHGFSIGAMLKAKEQVETLASVKGEPVVLRVALQAHFGGGLLQCALRDPDEPQERERRIDLPLERARFYEGYYRPYREWLASVPNARREVVRGQGFLVADLKEVARAQAADVERVGPQLRGRPEYGAHRARIVLIIASVDVILTIMLILFFFMPVMVMHTVFVGVRCIRAPQRATSRRARRLRPSRAPLRASGAGRGAPYPG